MGTRTKISLALVAVFLAITGGAFAQNPMPSLRMLAPEAFKGIDLRRQQVRKTEDPWFGLNPQDQCPISGRRLLGRFENYVDYKGHRIYLSDKRLAWIFRKFPRRAIRQLYDWGERPERLNLCQRCGHIKNSAKCCRRSLDTATCPLCRKEAKSPGCCVPADYKLPVPPPRAKR